jgi:hypothetical protein
MLVLAAALVAPLHVTRAQDVKEKSHASGFFIGGGIESANITTNSGQGITTTETGSGLGLVLGYGFSKRWSLYGELSGATIDGSGGGQYTLAHLDVGARLHFRTGPNRIVPFLQAAVGGRGVMQNANGTSVSENGDGFSFGGGFNAYFTSSVALTASFTETLGTFNGFKVGGTPPTGSSINASSQRAYLGILWVPHS